LHPLKGKRKGQYAIDVEHLKRLIIKPNHNPLPELADGGLDLSKVAKILVIEIENYH